MESIVGTIILIITGLFTYKGFRDSEYFERYKFEVDGILVHREWDRLLSSGFLHANWIHFGFNMIALLSFSWSLELLFGYGKFALLYFISLLGGSLLALFIHRNHGDYSAIGASGAVSGVVFASVVLFPEGSIGFVILPFEMPSWVFGLLFLLISIFGIKSQTGNIGHEAHLGGAITGVLATLVIEPSVIWENWWIILAILVPTTVFLVLIVRNPSVLLIDNYWGETVNTFSEQTGLSKRQKSRAEKEAELDYLLEKIRTKGINNLSKKERTRLDELRKEL